MKVICFHKIDEKNGYLSNWYHSDFTVDGIHFICMEQYMMYQKAIYFKDQKTAAEILNTDDPAEIKALGRQVANFDDVVWNGLRQIVVYQGLLEKFRQNPTMKQKLLATGDALMAECAYRDLNWGIGLSMTDPARFDTSKWRGRNLLGFALMMVREQLKGEEN